MSTMDNCDWVRQSMLYLQLIMSMMVSIEVIVIDWYWIGLLNKLKIWSDML